MKNATQKNVQSAPSKKGTRSRKSNAKTNQRQQIIYTASKLFHKNGYNKTSISEIARQIGLDQSSIYYWFPSKEAILESIYDANSAISVLQRIQDEVDDRVVQLYLLIVCDVVRKCELPFDFVEFENLVHARPEKYAGFLRSYREYFQAFESVISLGIEEGVFRTCPADEQAVTILSINEGLQHHYHAKQRNELILTICDYEVKDHSPNAIGHMAARTIIPGMLSHPQEMDDIREKALRAFEELGL